MKKYLVLFAAFVLTGCAARRSNVYGNSGKLYQAPELCQAVAQCMAAGEATCLYGQSADFNCGDKQHEPKATK
jgi:hypothetical protein